MKKLILILGLVLCTIFSYSQTYTAGKTFYQKIAELEIDNYSSIFKFGHNEAISATEQVVWDYGGDYIFLTAAETMDVVSTDVDDNSTGTGARTVILYGLNATWHETYEIITMTGTTVVTTDTSFLRLNRMIVITSGTATAIGDANEGTITATSSTTTTVQAQMGANNGQTLMCVYTVPAGKTGYVTGYSASVGEGKSCTFKGKFRNGVGGAFSIKFSLTLYQAAHTGHLVVPLRVPEKIDMVFTAVTTTGTVHADASFGMILKDN